MTEELDHWSRLGLIFEEAARLDPAARLGFVRHAAGGDAALEREVLSLLAAHANAGAFLDSPVADVGAELLGSPSRPAAPGRMLGPYRIVDELGEGGMGLVFLAEDTRLGRQVALKVLGRADVRSATSRERLRREARAAALLSHPGIATVYALEDFDGELCLAVEHVEGCTLREWLDEQERPLEAVVALASEVASALEAAHRGGVVHRDLKPENIMVDRHGKARILDFGIAHVVGTGEPDPRLTEHGASTGTPAYMAPEQLQGDGTDFRTDVFAFGIVLYEMVAGIHPFQGPTSTATQARILTATPAGLARYRSPVPPALQRIVSTCLRKAPADRYQDTARLVRDVSAVADALDARVATGGQPSPADMETNDPFGRETLVARRWWRVHQCVLMGTLLGMLVASRWVTNWMGGTAGAPVFFALLATGVCAGTIRGHLLFVEWSRPAAIRIELRRVAKWLRVLEVAFGLLSGAAALAIGSAHPLAGTLVLAAAVIMTVSIFAMEPATTRSAFSSPPEPPTEPC